ncbi:sulfatase family protein [Stratiformator vulcanicus]|uniref:Arylsulfatase n=1 Tax=Stratiformator vulcanicus TaxID=2527980 RepID=A0A517R702_9PLAN|nr:arylsulfatase [Stratiformator vulcanicus]QDT39611.1 Arylsulfatase precursor [Stratiformator vulcanicus]
MRSALLILVLLAATTEGFAESDPRPNIVLILADDLGVGDLGCYNPESKIPTPHMDALATDGIRYTDAHSPSSVCTPTRYAILTGRYAWRSRLKQGVLWGYDRLLIEPGRPTIPSVLKNAGYRTAGIGKWHLGLQEYDSGEPDLKTDYSKPMTPGPTTVGFEHYFGIPASLDMPPYVWIEDEGLESPPTRDVARQERRWAGGAGFWRAGKAALKFDHADVLPRIGRRAAAYITKTAPDEDPFFLYVPLSAPHTPWLPLAENEGKSGAGWYGDFVTTCDDVVGEIMQSLRDSGTYDNTVIFLTSDNGAHWRPSDVDDFDHEANRKFRGMKADIHEGGHRVPLIVKLPLNVERPLENLAGTTCDCPVCLTDLAVSCADFGNAAFPKGFAEDSFRLKGAIKFFTTRAEVIHHSLDGMFAIRQGDWKLIDGLGSGGFTKPKRITPVEGEPQGQLYNLKDDPAETHNVWGDHPELVARLTARLNEIRDSGTSKSAE